MTEAARRAGLRVDWDGENKHMRRRSRFVLLAVALVSLGAGLTGCRSEPLPTLDEAEVRDYAHEATEACLQGLSERDLAKYVQHANEEFKAAVTQEILDKGSAQITNSLGAYQSKEFLRAEEQEGYVIVHYKATYQRGPVGVRMVFDADHLIAGQWFE